MDAAKRRIVPADVTDPTEQRIRLVPRAPKWMNLNRILVSVYKVMGFGVLTVILVGLIGYFGVNLFYLVDHHWILPTIISPTDDRVLQLSEQLAEQEALRQKLVIERFDLRAKLEDSSRIIAVENGFQERFGSAVQEDVRARRSELRGLRDLFSDYAATRQEILKSNQAFSGLSRQRSEELMGAHLVERDNYLTTNYELSQIAHSNLALAEKEVTLVSRTKELEHEIQAMEGTNHNTRVGGPLSYDALRMDQEFNHSMLEEARARDQRDALQQSLAAIDETIERYDHMLNGIRESPYLKAIERHLSIAFVPYDNLPGLTSGVNLYACRMGLLWCSKVGTLGQPLDGEVTGKHPLHSRLLRGVMADLDLKDSSWARQKVLFAGHPPLLF
jgi:hypothetical protein